MVQVIFVNKDGSNLGETRIDTLDGLKKGTFIGLITRNQDEELFTILSMQQMFGYVRIVVQHFEPCWN